MPDVVPLAEGIGAWHARHGRALPSLLRPGVTEDQVQEAEATIDRALPAEVRDLFRWRDGVDMARDITPAIFFPVASYMLPLRWALKERESLMTHGRCPSSWLPLFLDPLGVHHAIDCESRQIIESSSDDVPHLCYESLVVRLRTLLSAFEADMFFVDERRGLLGRDIPRFFELAAGLNPGIDYWQTRSA